MIPWSPLAGGWLTGRYRKGEPVPETGRARRTPDRFDYERTENQRKLDLVESLVALADEAGLSMTHLAMAFVLEHPGVTSAIIGPRTMEQLTDVLDGAGTRLTDDVLDRIDEIVPPGSNVNVADTGWEAASLRRSQRRRPRRPGR